MTLAKGNHLLKLDEDGTPLTVDRQSYIEWEIVDLSPSFPILQSSDVYHVALLRKVK